MNASSLSFRTLPLCHSERSEESREEKEKIHRFALNDRERKETVKAVKNNN